MSSFNKVILIGNLTQDPELKATLSGISVCTFSIAVNRRFSKEGEQACDFISIVAWRQSAEFVSRYFKKGNPILVCGQIQTRSWTDGQGQKRYVTEVVADEVTFVGAQGQSEANIVKPDSNARNLGIVGAVMPEAYGGSGAHFEEIPGDGDLPL